MLCAGHPRHSATAKTPLWFCLNWTLVCALPAVASPFVLLACQCRRERLMTPRVPFYISVFCSNSSIATSSSLFSVPDSFSLMVETCDAHGCMALIVYRKRDSFSSSIVYGGPITDWEVQSRRRWCLVGTLCGISVHWWEWGLLARTSCTKCRPRRISQPSAQTRRRITGQASGPCGRAGICTLAFRSTGPRGDTFASYFFWSEFEDICVNAGSGCGRRLWLLGIVPCCHDSRMIGCRSISRHMRVTSGDS